MRSAWPLQIALSCLALVLVVVGFACGSQDDPARDLRHYGPGERVTFASGLSCVVPSTEKTDLVLAEVSPRDPANPTGESLVPLEPEPAFFHCFNITSLSAEEDFGLAHGMKTHGVLVGRAQNGQVEVWYDSRTHGVCVFTHLPGKMLGCIVKWDSPQVRSRATALAVAASIWRQFSIDGATLPDKVQR